MVKNIVSDQALINIYYWKPLKYQNSYVVACHEAFAGNLI